MLSVRNDRSPTLFPPQVRGTDKQLNVQPWKHVEGNNVTFQLCCHQFSHTIQHNNVWNNIKPDQEESGQRSFL
jgi:hypothetical protein